MSLFSSLLRGSFTCVTTFLDKTLNDVDRSLQDLHFTKDSSEDCMFVLLDEVVYKTEFDLHDGSTEFLFIEFGCGQVEVGLRMVT